ncbi:MAG: phosphoribosylanthranilate isomerase [Bacteroidetes bacterium]|nr:phosphoribosylanthranilate isomerase [Bacteroidota bacterium]MCY4224948.1 phosphoribosylanthranilate isomerase [Bacteroidota bacterium]
MSCKVKICGITSLADARFCAGKGVDYLGFIQHPSSPRFIDAHHAKEIIEWIHGPESVGVFVNVDAETVNRNSETAGFDVVQLHGDESPAYCHRITLPVFKAFSVQPKDTARSLSRILGAYEHCVDAFLLDTWHPELSGGTGTSFDWSVAQSLSKDFRIILAGGLTPMNVQEAFQMVSPWGLDVSSGVEDSPGIKNFDLINHFFESIENHDHGV